MIINHLSLDQYNENNTNLIQPTLYHYIAHYIVMTKFTMTRLSITYLLQSIITYTSQNNQWNKMFCAEIYFCFFLWVRFYSLLTFLQHGQIYLFTTLFSFKHSCETFCLYKNLMSSLAFGQIQVLCNNNSSVHH